MAYDVESNRTLLENIYLLYLMDLNIYQKMYAYYCGFTDHTHNYLPWSKNADVRGVKDGHSQINSRMNGKVNVNFIKKFIKEEVSYSVGNDVTFISHSGDETITQAIQYNLAHWKDDHDSTLAKNMLIYSNSYELYYINATGEFCSEIISPRHGIVYTDEYDNILLFFHIFSKQFDEENKTYIDIYTPEEIIHCNDNFEEIADRDKNIFGVVPVGVARLSEEDWTDTIYNDIKSLQDAYERNLSDISQEITEFRNAYLWLNNIQLPKDPITGKTDTKAVKESGVLETKGDNKNINAAWLTKDINDSFIQNTLSTLEDKMYKVTFHINTNEKLQSNTSSLALRARLIGLEEKCKLNQKALSNCIKTRLKMLFLYLNWKKNTDFDYKDIKVKFTANIPMDDLMTAQIISQLGNKLSTETGLAQLSFVENPKEEIKKMQSEEELDPLIIGKKLLNASQTGGEDSGNTETN